MFSKLVGNDHIKEILKRFITNKRVPNSLLFTGEEGIGKRLFALEFASSLVCQNPQNGEACDKCRACLRAGKFTFPKPDDRDEFKKVIFSEHADIGTVIPYKRNILVDAIRHLETEANFRPYEASNRFFIINDADKMNDRSVERAFKNARRTARNIAYFSRYIAPRRAFADYSFALSNSSISRRLKLKKSKII